MKLLITGGHVTPALAVLDEIKKNTAPIDIIFVGRKYANNHSTDETFEYKEITARQIPFYNLKTGRLSRVMSMESMTHLMHVPKGFLHAYRILKETKPDKVLSFGGYIALPVACAAHLLNIPVYTHEQTIHPGVANQIISRFAQKTFLSFQESKKYLHTKNTSVVGNPIRDFIFKSDSSAFMKTHLPVLYITGGSLGSHSINILIEKILPQLLEKYYVVHQTGNVKEFNDHKRLEALKATLQADLQQNYLVCEHLTTKEMGSIYTKADLVIGRSGANTFFELLALKKPALFIPLPWAGHNEQYKQAELFKKWGVGEVFNQYHSAESLLELINTMVLNIETYNTVFKTINTSYEKNAAHTIVDAISE